MKKNESIYKALQNMPERYIESAYEEKAVRKSGISWRSAVSAAACFLLIVSLPVYIMTRKPVPAESIIPDTAETTAVSMEESVPVQEKCDNSQLIESIRNINCTEISTFIPDGKSIAVPDSDGYYRIHFLVNKNLESEINSDIEALSDYLYENFHDEYGDELYEYSSFPDPEDLKRAHGIRCTIGAVNGYLTVEMCYFNGRVQHMRTLNYNLVTEKKINDFSEMFLDPENYIQAVNDFYRESDNGYDESILSGNPERFTCYGFYDNSEYDPGYYIMGYGGLPEASGFIPQLVNYDMSGLIEEEYIYRNVFIPDNLYSDCTENGVTYRFINEGEGGKLSRDTADAVNTVLRRLEDDAVKKFRDEFGDLTEIRVEAVSTPYIDSRLLMWIINISGYDNDGVRTVHFDDDDHTEEIRGITRTMGYMYDAVTEEPVNLTDIISPDLIPEPWPISVSVDTGDYEADETDEAAGFDRGYISISSGENMYDSCGVDFVSSKSGMTVSSGISFSDLPQKYIAE